MRVVLRVLSVAFVAGALLTNVARAGGLEDGVNAFHAGDYATARTKIEPLARQANPIARHYLARMHLKGLGAKQDFKAAYQLFLAAGQQGHGLSQVSAAGMAALGLGTKQDTALANHLWLVSVLLVDGTLDKEALAALKRLSPLLSKERKQQIGDAVAPVWALGPKK
jgi:TPR repeat protein